MHPTHMLHSENKCVHFSPECCIVGYGTCLLCYFWDWAKLFRCDPWRTGERRCPNCFHHVCVEDNYSVVSHYVSLYTYPFLKPTRSLYRQNCTLIPRSADYNTTLPLNVRGCEPFHNRRLFTCGFYMLSGSVGRSRTVVVNSHTRVKLV